MIDWAKLRHEWRTFVLAVAATLVSAWDIIVSNGLDYRPLIPHRYDAWVGFGLPLAMLMLRRWRNYERGKNVVDTR